MSKMNSLPCLFIEPIVSRAIGTEICDAVRIWIPWKQLARSAAEAVCSADKKTQDCAVVPITVTSYATQLPFCYVIMEIPSGRLPSERHRHKGSLDEGIWALDKARQIMSLMK